MNIIIENLTLSYDSHPILEDLSLEISSGRKVCIAGRSGSGKTSFLKSLMGFVIPSCGDITIGDQKLNAKSVWSLRQNIAYVSQEPDLGDGTVIERVQKPFRYKANAHAQCERSEIVEYFNQFQLPEKLLDKQTADLSGGEKQRIAIIIALMLNRPILILDEPVSAMDPQNKQAFKDLLAADHTRTVLFISHDVSLLDIADQTIDLSAFSGGDK